MSGTTGHDGPPHDVDLFDGHYRHLAADPYVGVRRETYDEDLGQTSWITLAEARQVFRALGLTPERTVLEVACGSGGLTCRMALETGARSIGIDIVPHAIDAARARAQELGVTARASFHVADARRALPFPDESFDALYCNDSFNHFPRRAEVLREWRRVLRPGGRVVVTDPVVVTGPVTSAELRARSSIGLFLFVPAGYNERLLAECGFALDEVRDVTEAVAAVSGRWMDARARRRAALVELEGDTSFTGLQGFLHAVHTLSRERRLSRHMYIATASSLR